MIRTLAGICFTLLIVGASLRMAPAAAAESTELVIVVMDPLAAPLSCPCVKGYAQRDYDRLGVYLQDKLRRPVRVVYNESLAAALRDETAGKVDIVVGKHSVVAAYAQKLSRPLTPAFALAGKDGKTVMQGLIVVPAADPAKSVADLQGYRVIFGPSDCDEKHAAALALLKSAGVAAPSKLETCEACSDGATKILELGPKVRAATVISSYAAPLLEGCGTIQKGDLRVVGKTADVPFVELFIADALDNVTRRQIEAAIGQMGEQPELLVALETRRGFVALEEKKKRAETVIPPATIALATAIATAQPSPDDNRDWPGWLGRSRTAEVAWLPEKLTPQPSVMWRRPLEDASLGGVAVVLPFVLVSDREGGDTQDVLRCLDAATGNEVWSLRYPARGKLDYGNSSRATPLVVDDLVYFAGAHGDIHAVQLRTGKIEWKRNLARDFGLTAELKWGYCASPLVVRDRLILYAGGQMAALVALDRRSGEVAWKVAGRPPAYGSLVAGMLGDVEQIVGHDAERLVGWDAATGRELWSVEPELPGDFNVPTPRIVDGRLLVATEGNGTRLFAFEKEGKIVPQPAATFPSLAPGTHTPVSGGGRVFGIHEALFCLDLKQNLKLVWRARDKAFQEHTNLFVGAGRLLIVTGEAELILVDAQADTYRVLGRQRVLADESGLLSHPALVGSRLYLRGSREIVCVDLVGPVGGP